MKLFSKYKKVLELLFFIIILFTLLPLLTFNSLNYSKNNISSIKGYQEYLINDLNLNGSTNSLYRNKVEKNDYLHFYNEFENKYYWNDNVKLYQFSYSELKSDYYIIDDSLTKVYKIENNDKIEIFSTDINYEYIVDFKPKVITTTNNIYILDENKNKFFPISLNGINKNATLKCSEILAINSKKYVFVGTSHHGLYYKEMNSLKFIQINKNIQRVPYTSNSTSYFETISNIINYNNIFLIFSYKYSTRIGLLTINDKGELKVHNFVYDIRTNKEYSNLNPDYTKKDLNNISENSVYKLESIENMSLNNEILKFETNQNIYNYHIKISFLNNESNEIKENKELYKNSSKIVFNNIIIELNLDNSFEKGEQNIQKNDYIRGLYIPVHHLSNEEKILKKINFLKELNLNAIVVDLKDDFGYVTYNSNSQYAKKVGSIKKIVDIDKLLKLAHENNIKIIGRLVCFRDPFLFKFENSKYAFYDKRTNQPWIGLEKEKWVDPASEFVVNYIIDIAKDLEQKGIDEIQLDYVRYPSDGGVSNIYSIYNTKNYSKNSVLYNFLKNLKNSLSINTKLSSDFYGYQCFYNITKHIGQDIYILSNFIDVVYPMYYPSHFTYGFYQNNLKQNETNFYIYNHGVQRATLNSKKPIIVRPWIQVFKMKVEIDYKDYIQSQIDGVLKAGYNSFIFWNPAGKYDILREIKH